MSQDLNDELLNNDSLSTISTSDPVLIQDHTASSRVQLSPTTRVRHLSSELSNGVHELAQDTRAGMDSILTPISAIPPEIMMAIFEHVVETQRPRPPVLKERRDWCMRRFEGEDEWSRLKGEIREPDFLGGRGGDLGWLKLGHVAYLWREIILSQPLFWARDIGSLPLGTSQMLKRAGQAPLTLHLYTSSYRKGYDQVVIPVETNESYIQRVRQISFVHTLYCGVTQETLRGHGDFLCAHEFPALESLYVYANEPENPDWFATPYIVAPLLHKVHFTNHALAFPDSLVLREFTITRVRSPASYGGVYYFDSQEQYIILHSLRLSTLTHLHVFGILDEESTDEGLPGPNLLWESQLSFPNMQHTYAVISWSC